MKVDKKSKNTPRKSIDIIKGYEQTDVANNLKNMKVPYIDQNPTLFGITETKQETNNKEEQSTQWIIF